MAPRLHQQHWSNCSNSSAPTTVQAGRFWSGLASRTNRHKTKAPSAICCGASLFAPRRQSARINLCSVDCVFQTLACFELWLVRGLDRHRFTGTGVATSRSLSLRNRESPKTNQAHFVTAGQSLRDRFKNAFDGTCSITFGKAAVIGNRTDKVVLVHSGTPMLSGIFQFIVSLMRKTGNWTNSSSNVKGNSGQKAQNRAKFGPFKVKAR